MEKAIRRVMPILLSMLLLTLLTGCGSRKVKVPAAKNAEAVFDIMQFKKEMKAKSYKFKIENANRGIIPTTRKRMIIGKEALDIYLFKSSKDVENAVKNISRDGSRVFSAEVDWIAPPHFYKKGCIIVQYIGENKKINADLKEIMGNQFAGGK